MSMIGGWLFMGARWILTAAGANKPATGSGEGYVPTLQADDTVVWQAALGELLVDDASGEILFDDATGDVLYDG